MRITVFTPTYNRGYIIEKLYDSLKKQSFNDFEWIVVNDGSTDDTDEIFAQILKNDNDFPINYIKTINGGKHRAINIGVKQAKGELFFIVDSDDYLPENALERIDSIECTIESLQKKEFAGVCGLKAHMDGSIVGTTFNGDILDITSLQRSAHRVDGDKAEVFYTEVLRKYPFPEYKNENFMTECVVWDKIANDGLKLRFFNEKIYCCEYLPDGLTANSRKSFESTPKGHGLYVYQSILYGKIKGLRKWEEYLNYYYLHRKQISFFEMAKNLYVNPLKLYVRLLGMRVYYKLYDR